jgi:hypothetical protein
MEESEALDLADALTERARRCRAAGRPAEAETHYRRALAILADSVEPDHPSRTAIEHHYATLLAELGRDAEAAWLGARSPTEAGGQNGP